MIGFRHIFLTQKKNIEIEVDQGVAGLSIWDNFDKICVRNSVEKNGKPVRMVKKSCIGLSNQDFFKIMKSRIGVPTNFVSVKNFFRKVDKTITKKKHKIKHNYNIIYYNIITYYYLNKSTCKFPGESWVRNFISCLYKFVEHLGCSSSFLSAVV